MEMRSYKTFCIVKVTFQNLKNGGDNATQKVKF